MSSIRARWIFAALVAATAVLAHCQASADDQRLDGDFAKRMFAGSASKPKAYACFIRRYDAEHLAQHVAEKGTDDKMLEYSFRLGVNFRHCPGDFDSSGECGHAPTVRAQNSDTDLPFTTRIDFNCDVDCDGGGIAVNLANNDGSMIVKLDRIRIWKGNSPDEGCDRVAGWRRRQGVPARSDKLERVHPVRRRPQGIGRDAAQVTRDI